MIKTETIARNDAELKLLSDWYDAIQINDAMKDKAHAECAAYDHDAKLNLTAYLDEVFSKIKYPEMNLPENEAANVALAMALNTALLDYEAV